MSKYVSWLILSAFAMLVSSCQPQAGGGEDPLDLPKVVSKGSGSNSSRQSFDPPGIRLISPQGSVSNSLSLVVEISGLSDDETIILYKDANCSDELVTKSHDIGNKQNISISPISEGTYNLAARRIAPDGESTLCSTFLPITIDRTPPQIPNAPTFIQSRGNSRNPTMSVSGLGSGETAKFYSHSACSVLNHLATVPANSLGKAEYTLNSENLTSDGEYSFYVSATDSAGNESDCSSAGNYTLDTTAPAEPTSISLSSPSSSPASDSTPSLTISGVTIGDQLKLFSDSSCTQARGDLTISSNPQVITSSELGSDGSYSFHVILEDSLGNVSNCSSISANYVLDTTVPAEPSSISLSSPSSSPGSDSTPSFSISGVTIGDQLKLFSDSSCTQARGVVTISGNPQVITSSELSSDGSYSFHVVIEDSEGNTSTCSSISASYVLDTTAPTITLSTPDKILEANQNSYTISGTCSEDDETIALEVGTATSSTTCSNGVWSDSLDVSSVLDSESITVKATHVDAAGNSSFTTQTTSKDSSKPQVQKITTSLNGTYGRDGLVEIFLNFDKEVTITGSPCVGINVGPNNRDACYSSGSGTSFVTFSYTVQSSDSDDDGIAISENIKLDNSATIKSDIGNTANLSLSGSIPDTSGILVDGSQTPAPAINSISQTNLSADLKSATIQWSSPSSNVTSYTVRYRYAGSKSFTYLSPRPTNTTATLTSLTPSKDYEVQVAVYEPIMGNFSPVLSFTTRLNPAALGSILWFEARDIDESGNPLPDGTAITTIKDKSDRNNDLTIVDPNNKATIETVDGYKVIRMGGEGGYVTSASLGETNNTDLEVYIVAKTRQVTKSFAFCNENCNDDNNRFGAHFPWSDENAYIDLPMGNRFSGNWGGNTDDFFAWTFRSSTTSGRALERDGVQILSGSGRSLTPPLKKWYVGAGPGDNFQNTWMADVQAFFVFEKVLDQNQREGFFSYIAENFGINKFPPRAPSGLFFDPSSGNSTSPTLNIEGLRPGTKAKIYSNSGCTTSNYLGLSSVPDSNGIATYEVNSSVFGSNGTYTFSAKGSSDVSGDSVCSEVTGSYVLD